MKSRRSVALGYNSYTSFALIQVFSLISVVAERDLSKQEMVHRLHFNQNELESIVFVLQNDFVLETVNFLTYMAAI